MRRRNRNNASQRIDGRISIERERMIITDNGDKRKSAYLRMMDEYGVFMQHTVAMEECAELIQAISKVIRQGNDIDKMNMAGEMADVLIMMEQMMLYNGITLDDLKKHMDGKIERMESKGRDGIE